MNLWHAIVGALLACGTTVLVFMFKWFMLATDVKVNYNWTQSRVGSRPNFDIRNRSRSKTYLLGNIVYKKGNSIVPIAIDNKSLWEKELKPGSITFFQEVAPVGKITTLEQCMETKVYVRLQNEREMKGEGPGQLPGRWKRSLNWVRLKLESGAVPAG
jgi:hypothetical protein